MNDYQLLEDLIKIYEKEIKKRVKNKRRIFRFELYKMEYLLTMQKELINNQYDGGQYNLFLINKPKTRLIMSQAIYDKIINHYITRNILEPKLTKYLCDENVATRTLMGTSYAIELFKKQLERMKKYDDIYVLKLDIRKYFYSIDHEVLKKLIKEDLTEREQILINRIIDSTNASYINEYIKRINEKYNTPIPNYEKGKGLPIGNMTSQFLAIFYLNRLHRYIKEELGLEKIIIYMDDYIILHQNREYLKSCLKIIEEKLQTEYKLNLNKNKTIIRNIKCGIDFLGYTFKVINKKTIIKLTKDVKKKMIKNLKKLKYENEKDLIEFEELFSVIMNYQNSYKYASKIKINKIVKQYWY